MQQMTDLEERSIAAANHRSARAELQRAIKASKRGCLDELIRLAEENEFKIGYRAVMARIRGSWTPKEMDRAILDGIVSDLFPEHLRCVWRTSLG